jgi:hypothetical protein
MGIAFSTLVSRLEGLAPAQNEMPSRAQYEQYVRDAVWDFSRRAPMQKTLNLSIVSGTASYTLPSDFFRLIRLASTINLQEGVMNTPSGLIAVSSSSFRERIMVQGGSLVIYPTPTYTMTRELWYMAAYVLNAIGLYADLTEETAAIVMLKGQALALGLLANQAAQQAWSYSIGDESVTKTSQAPQMREQVKGMEAEYLDAVRKHIGSVMRRGMATDTFGA